MRSDPTKDFRSLRRFSLRLLSRNLAVKVFNPALNASSASVGRSIFGVGSDCSMHGAAAAIDARKSSALWVTEPFRIFFPLGLLLGAIGVALWPLFVWHSIGFYPAQAHVRLMIEGLMGSFIIGFLGTAGPVRVDQCNRRNLSGYRSEIDGERLVREPTRQSNAQRRLCSVSNSRRRRVFLS